MQIWMERGRDHLSAAIKTTDTNQKQLKHQTILKHLNSFLKTSLPLVWGVEP